MIEEFTQNTLQTFRNTVCFDQIKTFALGYDIFRHAFSYLKNRKRKREKREKYVFSN